MIDSLRALVCPACRGELSWGQAAACESCSATYPIEAGIPILRSATEDAQKSGQARFFDEEADPEFEITRPHGTPPFHQWLLREKFRRGTSNLRSILPGSLVLVVCGGSGMDAELLAREGAQVISSDLSMGAAKRARDRACRFGFELTSIVADVERLPVADLGVDIAYVHDGLHHIERPLSGLAEMARVARRAVAVTEPASAAATALAVRVGLAQEVEEAGNRVRRLSPADVAEKLAERGFRVLRAERYAMYYRHVPGRPARVLSRDPLFALARGGFRLANRLGGGLGNKLTVQAVRES